MKIPFLTLQFWLLFVLTLAAFVFKGQHWPGTFVLVVAAMLAHLIYITSVLTEVFTSKLADMGEKLVWVVSFAAGVAGLFFIMPVIFSFILIGAEATYLKKRSRFLPA